MRAAPASKTFDRAGGSPYTQSMQSDSLPSQTHSLIERLGNESVQAFRDHDFKTMDDLHDTHCMGVGILGAQYAKSAFIKAFKESLRVHSLDVVSTRIVVEDSFAVVLSNWDVNISVGPSVIEGRVRVTRTWVKRPHGWKVICFHLSDARLATAWEKLKSGKEPGSSPQ